MLALYLSLCNSEEENYKITYIYEKYYDLMYRAVYRVVPNAETARDLVYDTMVKIIKNSETIRMVNECSLKSYLITAAKHTAFDHTRIKSNQPMVDIDELYAYLDTQSVSDSMQELLITQERYDEVVRCIRTLPDTLQEACCLKYVCELDDKAIATALNISYANVAMRVHRGRALLQKKLAEVRNNEKINMMTFKKLF